MQQENGSLPKTITLLGVRVHALTLEELHELLSLFIAEKRHTVVLHVNAHCLNLAYQYKWLRDYLNSADVVFADGYGVILAALLWGYRIPKRITYADWAWQLAQLCVQKDFSLYFLGARPGIAQKAAARLQERFPALRIVGTQHGYFDKSPTSPDNQAVLQSINAAKPDMLIVGFGMPIQERWLLENWEHVEAGVALVGGAVFDYVSGDLQRGPRWMTDHGLEWLVRLIIEPKRLWRRYLIGNPLFLWRIAKQRLGLVRFDRKKEPERKRRYISEVVKTVKLLGVHVHTASMQQTLSTVQQTIRNHEHVYITYVNVHALNLGCTLPWFRAFLNQSKIAFCDGFGVKWGARLLGHTIPHRFTPPDWIDDLASMASQNGFTIFLLGSRPGVAAKVAALLQQRFPDLQIVGVHHGYFDKTPGCPENESVIQAINTAKPNILLIGFGMPLQEHWLKENWDNIEVNVALTGGAIFDYVSGELRRGPRWMTDHGLEWLARLIIEPRRLWRRYIIGNPRFLWRVLKQRLGLLRLD